MSFTRNDARDHRDSFQNYYLPNVEMKDFNVLIYGKSLFALPVKNEKKLTGKLLRWTEIMTTQLVTYWILFMSKKLQINLSWVTIDLSKQTKLKFPQQISFICRLEKQGNNNNHGATMFSIIEKIRRNYFWIFTKFCEHHIKM